jgi:glycosyltransferase involved in cell wall biosynthesis
MIKNRVNVLFICWGFSIHAKRRIRIFCDDPRFKVSVASTFDYQFSPANNVKLPSDCNVRELPGYWNIFKTWWIAFKALVILFTTVARIKPEVIFLHTLMFPCYLAYFLPKRIPIIITFWNGDVIWWAKWNGIERALKKKIVITGVRRANAITVNSQMALDKCIEYGAPKERISLIRYPGVNMALFKPKVKAASRKILNTQYENILLWPRGLGGYLNSDILLDAAPIIIKEFPKTQFIILSKVGESTIREFSDELKKRDIYNNFRFDSQVDHRLMPDYYNAADAMITISSNDSLPNVMLESLSCGTPVIAGDIEQLREWIVNKHTGFLVPPRDHKILAETILFIINNKNSKLVNAVIKNGLIRARKDADSRKNIPAIKQLVIDTATSANKLN